MEDATYRSFRTVLVTALGVILIGAGCTGKTEPPQQPVEVTPQVQAPAPKELQKAPVPFVACYHGEADLFLSTANVPDIWQDQIRQEINNGWLIDIWCKELSDNGAMKYSFAFRKSQGLLMSDIATAKINYQNSGRQNQAPKIESESQSSEWSLVKIGYVSSEKNRANEIPLLLSDVIAINNEVKPFDSISFSRDLNDVVSAPRVVIAEMHGGGQKGWFSVRFSYNPNTKVLKTNEYCRTYFDSEDGSFSPQDMKSECESK